MITERVGDLLTEPDLTHIAHQANLFHTFGAGLALQIARKYPYALAADKQTPYGDPAKLGTYSYGVSGDDRPNVVNLYSQAVFAHDVRGGDVTDYVALRKALTALETYTRPASRVARLGVPYGLGCGLAGGSWPKVYGILEAVFGTSPVLVVVVRRPEDLLP